MEPIIKQQYIASLILKEKLMELTAEEQKELTAWREADTQNERTYQSLRKHDSVKDLKSYEKIGVQQGWKRYRERYVEQAVEKKSPYLYRKVWGWSVAAAVVLVFGLSLFMLLNDRAESEQVIVANNHAVLVLSDGQTVNLGEETSLSTADNREVVILNAGKELQYSAGNIRRDTNQEKYNEVIIPKGGELVVVLSDGSKVWLNSQTKLRYPVVFCGDLRDVYLEGEAYFEVAKDKDHPFYVHANNGVSVKVLGTSFNVRSYGDEEEVTAVLEEGAVQMYRGEDQVVLKPGQLAVYRVGENIKVETVDTERYTSWRNGQYVFVNERFEDVLRQLARWYDVEVFYSDEGVRDLIISGDVKRYDNIQALLEALGELGNVRLNLKGRTLVVSPAG